MGEARQDDMRAFKRLTVAIADRPGDHSGGRQSEIEIVQRLHRFESHKGAVAVRPTATVGHFNVAVPVHYETVAPRIEIHQHKASLPIRSRDSHMRSLAVDRFQSKADLVQWFACDGVDHCPRKRTLFRWLVLQRKEQSENEQQRRTIRQQ
jgi:hypothetical protein